MSRDCTYIKSYWLTDLSDLYVGSTVLKIILVSSVHTYRDPQFDINGIYINVQLSLCLIIKHHAMKAYGGSGCIDPSILDLGTS
jgi:hypothetical protein